LRGMEDIRLWEVLERNNKEVEPHVKSCGKKLRRTCKCFFLGFFEKDWRTWWSSRTTSRGGPGLTKSMRQIFLQVCINGGAMPMSNFLKEQFLVCVCVYILFLTIIIHEKIVGIAVHTIVFYVRYPSSTLALCIFYMVFLVK